MHMPNYGRIADNSVSQKWLGLWVLGIRLGGGRPRGTHHLKDHFGLCRDEVRVHGFAPDRASRFHHPSGQEFGITSHGVVLNISRNDEGSVTFVSRNPNAVSLFLQDLGETTKGHDIPVGANHHNDHIQGNQGQLKVAVGARS
jgi:hypothetical protein